MASTRPEIDDGSYRCRDRDGTKEGGVALDEIGRFVDGCLLDGAVPAVHGQFDTFGSDADHLPEVRGGCVRRKYGWPGGQYGHHDALAPCLGAAGDGEDNSGRAPKLP